MIIYRNKKIANKLFLKSFIGFLYILHVLIFLIAVLLAIQTNKSPVFANSWRDNTTQNGAELPLLDQSQPLERELTGGGEHIYKILLAKGQFLHLTVDQRGIDIVLRLYKSDGTPITTELDSPNGSKGIESLFIVAPEDGYYKLVIRSLEKTATDGHYQIKIIELHLANEKDYHLAEAKNAYAEAEELIRSKDINRKIAEMALTKYLNALSHWQVLIDHESTATTLYKIGDLYTRLRDNEKGIEYFIQAADLREKIGDIRSQGRIIIRISTSYLFLNKTEKALDYMNQALNISIKADDVKAVGNIYSNMAAIYDERGELKRALGSLQKALPFQRDAKDPDPVGQAVTLNGIGAIYDKLGDKFAALEYYSQALKLREAQKDPIGKAITLSNIGLVKSYLGEKQAAMDAYFESMSILEKNNSNKWPKEMGITLNNIGLLYDELGDTKTALNYYMRSVEFRNSAKDRLGLCYTLHNMAKIYFDNNFDSAKAIDLYNQVMKIRQEIGDNYGLAYTLTNLGTVYSVLGEREKGLDYYKQALDLRKKVRDKQGEAITTLKIGLVYLKDKNLSQALEYLNSALLLSREVKDKRYEAATLYWIAIAKRLTNQLEEACTNISSAIEITKDLRTNVDNKDLRARYFATVNQYYELYIDLLMQMHKQDTNKNLQAQALYTAESSRARSLLDILGERGTEISNNLPTELVDREQQLRQQLVAKKDYQIRLLSGQSSTEQLMDAENDIKRLESLYEQLKAEMRKQTTNVTPLVQSKPLILKEIQDRVLTDENTLLLEYSLGKERSYLWAVSKNTIDTFELPAKDKIDAAVANLYKILTARNKTVKEDETWNTEGKKAYQTRVDEADKLFQNANNDLVTMILKPAESLLGTKRLLIVADGSLQNIPFTVLSLNQARAAYKPLVVDHEIIDLPSVSIVEPLRIRSVVTKSGLNTIAVFADPVFSKTDSRIVTKIKDTAKINDNIPITPKVLEINLKTQVNSNNYKRLISSYKEAKEITKLFPGQYKLWTGFDVNRSTIMSAELMKSRIIHFATHYAYNNAHPELSALVLSQFDQDGQEQSNFLYLSDIYNLHWSLSELVVLSACNTQLGEDIKGEGLVGLTHAFMYAGAPHIVTSLWTVDDDGAAEFMRIFYQGLKQQLTAAAALRNAQKELFKQQKLSSPYYWAGFTLQGLWEK